jgi:hypothetical protein
MRQEPQRMTTRRSRLSLSALLAAAVAAAPLAGCSGVPGITPNPAAQPLAMDPADACYTQRAAFNDSPHFMTEKIVTGAAIGGLGGAAMGAGIAAASHGNILAGAAIGGAVGLLAGGAAGYFSGLQQQNQDAAELSMRVDSDLSEESRNISNITLAFDNLRRCRFTQAARIKLEARRHRIDNATAQDDLAYQRDRFNEELALAHVYGVNMEKQTDQFQYAAQSLQKQNAPNAARIDRTATETIPEKRGNFEDTVAKADDTAKVAFNLDSSAPTSWVVMPYA